MAILTNATFKKLVNKSSQNLRSEVNIDYTFFLENIYNHKILPFVFNKREKHMLFTTKCLLEDEKEFIFSYYNKLAIKKDEMRLVFSRGGKHKYHLYNDCEALSNIFVDFEIPQDITDLGEAVVSDFRLWFEKMEFKDRYFEIREKEENPNDETNFRNLANAKMILNKNIVEAYNKVYPAKYDLNPLDITYFLIREANNSGTTEIPFSFSIATFKNDLNNLIDKRIKLMKNRNPFREKLARYDFLLSKSDSEIYDITRKELGLDVVEKYGIETFKIFWEKHKKIKNEIYDLLFEFFKWTYGFKDKNFDEIDLQALGFECCKLCQTKRINEMSINQTI